jgi:NADPH:quinone reductase-like Zn-dependent oxidoreductase
VVIAALATSVHPERPLDGLEVREVAPEEVRDPHADAHGWATVRVRAASLNHHDVWTLRGVGVREGSLPVVLGTDAAGVDEQGRRVVVHGVVASPGWTGDETLDPRRSLLSEVHPGALAETVRVPAGNLVPLPDEISVEEASCLPTAWLTAYRMLFSRSGAAPGSTVLVQGAGGGVSTALVALGAATGYRVWVTSRSGAKRERALALGAAAAFAPGERLPERVDAVMESVGEATWAHSLRSLRPGGTVVVCGATSGAMPPSELQRVFFTQLRVVGSTMGSRDELARLLGLLVATGLRPVVDEVLPLTEAARGLDRLVRGDVFGKIVLTP